MIVPRVPPLSGEIGPALQVDIDGLCLVTLNGEVLAGEPILRSLCYNEVIFPNGQFRLIGTIDVKPGWIARRPRDDLWIYLQDSNVFIPSLYCECFLARQRQAISVVVDPHPRWHRFSCLVSHHKRNVAELFRYRSRVASRQ